MSCTFPKHFYFKVYVNLMDQKQRKVRWIIQHIWLLLAFQNPCNCLITPYSCSPKIKCYDIDCQNSVTIDSTRVGVCVCIIACVRGCVQRVCIIAFVCGCTACVCLHHSIAWKNVCHFSIITDSLFLYLYGLCNSLVVVIWSTPLVTSNSCCWMLSKT